MLSVRFDVASAKQIVSVMGALVATTLMSCGSDGSSNPPASGSIPTSSFTTSGVTLGGPADASASTSEADTNPGFADALGSPERVCVDVDSIVATEEPSDLVGPDEDVPVFNIRAGEILAGNFAYVVGAWSTFHDGVAKIYWVPLDRDVARTHALEVRVEPLEGDGQSETLTFGGDDTYALGRGGRAFRLSGTRFQKPGRYRLTVSAPGHWGCFELTV